MLPEQNFIINDGWDNVDKSNKDKTKRPGKGNFVVTIGDTKIVHLIQMPRPFQKLRELNFDDVVEKILEDGKYIIAFKQTQTGLLTA